MKNRRLNPGFLVLSQSRRPSNAYCSHVCGCVMMLLSLHFISLNSNCSFNDGVCFYLFPSLKMVNNLTCVHVQHKLLHAVKCSTWHDVEYMQNENAMPCHEDIYIYTANTHTSKPTAACSDCITDWCSESIQDDTTDHFQNDLSGFNSMQPNTNLVHKHSAGVDKHTLE